MIPLHNLPPSLLMKLTYQKELEELKKIVDSAIKKKNDRQPPQPLPYLFF
jgi:hypothetical protein